MGTSSLRRESQLRARFPHLQVQPLRGNVQTRLRKLDEGQFAAIILAAAGLKRLGLADRITALLSPEMSLPAVGQGALGIECRTDRPDLIKLMRPLHHLETAQCVEAERAMSRALGGSCQVPLGGFAEMSGGVLRLRGFVASQDGTRMISERIEWQARNGRGYGRPTGAESEGAAVRKKFWRRWTSKDRTREPSVTEVAGRDQYPGHASGAPGRRSCCKIRIAGGNPVLFPVLKILDIAGSASIARCGRTPR